MTDGIDLMITERKKEIDGNLEMCPHYEMEIDMKVIGGEDLQKIGIIETLSIEIDDLHHQVIEEIWNMTGREEKDLTMDVMSENPIHMIMIDMIDHHPLMIDGGIGMIGKQEILSGENLEILNGEIVSYNRPHRR